MYIGISFGGGQPDAADVPCPASSDISHSVAYLWLLHTSGGARKNYGVWLTP